jgi:hypothetical protein
MSADGAKEAVGFGILNHERHETREIEAYEFF